MRKRSNKFTNLEEMVQEVKLTRISCRQIAQKYGLSYYSLYPHFKRAGVIRENPNKQKRYILNENYFDNIDTEEKAYFLGFLYADGCNYKNQVTILALHPDDEDLLKLFNNALGSNRPILRESNKRGYGNNDICKIMISNKHMATQLSRLGCVPRKTYCLKFPTEDQVPKHLLKFFIKGYFDGDGTLAYYPRKDRPCPSFIIVFASNVDFIEGLANFLKTEFGINYEIKGQSGKANGFRTLRLRFKYEAIKFLHWMYKDSTLHLERKYQKYRKILVEEKHRMEKNGLILD